MRPGPIRPGDIRLKMEMDARAASFNEARADSPGRWVSVPYRGAYAPGFNEARADSPGRYPPLRPMRYGSRRFNEARADSPGRSG